MKRIALVAALAAAFAAPVFAQSSVTVYGRLNTSIERQKAGDESRTVLQNNASRLGFKGSEDLGGGLKANFMIEHRFNVDDGKTSGDAFWSGDSWVGLSGNFGAVRLGRQTSALYYATADYVSLHNHDTGSSSDALYAYNSRNQNKLSYITPSLGGLTGEVQYSLHEGASEDGEKLANQWELALNFDQGPLHLGGGYSKNDDLKVFAVRALYELGAFTFGGYYERDKFDDEKRNNFRLSGMYTLGASEFHLNVGVAGDLGDLDDTGAKQFTVGYNYNLSKRTKLFAFYTKLANDEAGIYGVGADNANAAPDDFSSFAVGLRHNF
ncbi:porin [Caldimonas brevitalea]|uniref:Porin n=1 Tax=Caldimonas brevitalea TaxID=413882 RepID=A0A0G3BWP2_9BURK|nr:porin [Caldimonas brevitalea]AKJ31776.1 porin [Caldimonas brevitalea]